MANRKTWVCGGTQNGHPCRRWDKMGIAIAQVLASSSLEPCFYARLIVRIALRRLTEKHSSSDKFNREIVITQG